MSGSPWFDWDEDLSEEAAAFLDAVRNIAASWRDADPIHSMVFAQDDDLVLGLDVSDSDARTVMRTLRVDYGASGLVHGEDETSQFVTPLTPQRHEYRQIGHGDLTPGELGRIAADWFRTEMIRPIELAEWHGRTFWYREYRLADSGRTLCWSADGNRPKRDLGPPDHVSAVVTRAKDG